MTSIEASIIITVKVANISESYECNRANASKLGKEYAFHK